MTVREIAALAQVSIATVSRYMADKQSVSAECRRKIESVLPDSAELTRRGRKAAVIALLLPCDHFQFYQYAMNELCEQAPEMGFRLAILPAVSNEHTGWYEMLKALKPCGVIGLNSSLDPETERWWQENEKARIVLLGEETRHENVSAVRINDIAAVYEGTNYLLGLGHHKICFFTNHPYEITTSFQRLTGAQRAMHEAGVDITPHLRFGSLTYPTGYRLAKELAEKREGYTAIFAFSDEMALGAITALEDAGLRVPEDVSVLGIDDLPIASRARPALTTIHQPLKDMVHKTLELLGAAGTKSCTAVLPHKLIERGTCRSIKEDESR